MRMIKILHALSRLSLAIFISSNAPAQSGTSTPGEAGPYHVSLTFHVGGEGAWDYLTVDPEHQLLFVPRSTHMMVLDARTGKTLTDIPGQKRNHGVRSSPAPAAALSPTATMPPSLSSI